MFSILFMVRKWKRRKKQIRAFCLGVIFVYLGLTVPVDQKYEDTAAHLRLKDHVVWMAADHLAGMKAAGVSLNKETEEWMAAYMPLEEWASDYNVYGLPAAPEKKWEDFIAQNSISSVLPFLVKSVMESPLYTLNMRLNKTKILWSMEPLSGNQHFMYFDMHEPNHFGLTSENNMVLSNPLLQWHVVNGIGTRISFSIAFYLVLLALFWFAFSLIQKKRLRWCFVPLLANHFFLFIGTSWQDFRYYYAVVPITALFILLILCETGLYQNAKPRA